MSLQLATTGLDPSDIDEILSVAACVRSKLADVNPGQGVYLFSAHFISNFCDAQVLSRFFRVFLQAVVQQDLTVSSGDPFIFRCGDWVYHVTNEWAGSESWYVVVTLDSPVGSSSPLDTTMAEAYLDDRFF